MTLLTDEGRPSSIEIEDETVGWGTQEHRRDAKDV
jgi:hypothetical protein